MQKLSYLTPAENTRRIQNIRKRRSDMPTSFRRKYDQAQRGSSQAAAIFSFCAECTGWDRDGVRECTAFQCPLWLYRPFKSLKNGHDGQISEPESTNSGQEVG